MDEPEPSDDLKPKTAEQTAQRVLALLVTIGKVHDPAGSVHWMKKHDLGRFLSPDERAFVEEPRPSERSRVAFSWRAEAMVPLLWALNLLAEMPPFHEQFDVFSIEALQTALKDPLAFISKARLRDDKDISDMEGKLYHLHWRVRDRDLGLNVGKSLDPRPGDPPIEELDSGIVQERRYGLSWLVGWGEDWDNVPTDT